MTFGSCDCGCCAMDKGREAPRRHDSDELELGQEHEQARTHAAFCCRTPGNDHSRQCGRAIGRRVHSIADVMPSLIILSPLVYMHTPAPTVRRGAALPVH